MHISRSYIQYAGAYIPSTLQKLPMKRSGSRVECSRVNTDLAALPGRYSSELGETDIVADSETNTSESYRHI